MIEAGIAVAIPAYQAAPTVAEVVARAARIVAEILVVDDGSTDGTGDRAAAAGARVIRHGANLGKGRALRTAFDDLFGRGYSAVATLDADGQHLPEELPLLFVPARRGAQLVLGGRRQSFAAMSRVRRTSNRWSSLMISAFAGEVVHDAQSGFRLYDRGLIEATGFPETGYEAESAVIVRAARLGFRIVSVPIRLGRADGRGTSHYRPIADSLRIAAAVVRARLEVAGAARRNSAGQSTR